jgi:hypothetical protein
MNEMTEHDFQTNHESTPVIHHDLDVQIGDETVRVTPLDIAIGLAKSIKQPVTDQMSAIDLKERTRAAGELKQIYQRLDDNERSIYSQHAFDNEDEAKIVATELEKFENKRRAMGQRVLQAIRIH